MSWDLTPKEGIRHLAQVRGHYADLFLEIFELPIWDVCFCVLVGIYF